ncbi:MAG: hypothetical protein RKP20_08950, partial [Candidatus Competibacter sp.]|nr:hypothetical protein [Candidatus Competibacter sp.]
TGAVYTVNKSVPTATVAAIALADPNPTAAASVRWTVTFSSAVVGLTASNLALVPGGDVTGAAITGVSGSGTIWTVTAGTGTGTGTLGLNLANATGLTPAVTNVPFTGAVYTINKSAPPVTGLAGIAWSGDQFVAVGPGGAIQTSPDGAAWTSQPSGTTQDLYGVAWSGQRFVAVGAGGLILASADGQIWTTQPAGTVLDLWGIAWSGGQFAVVGEGGVILTSPDGLTWTVRLTGTP